MPEWLLVVLLLVVILFLVTVFLALVLLEIAQRLREINKLLEVIARDAEWLVEACMGA
jgi:ABC-type polysaccharide/polyol phosphate export permease